MVGLYCRVSTDEQAQQGFSIDNQKERLAAYCVSQGWDEHRFYIDDGYTGTNMERPALQRMIQHSKEGKLQTILVYKLDRLGRKQKDVLFLLEDVFDKHNVTFKSATEPFDTSTSLGKAMLGILAVFAQLERDTIIERTKMGRRMKMQKGLWAGGRIPFGYHWNKEAQRLEIIPEEADIVREIYRQFLQGKSFLSISDWATEHSKMRYLDHTVIIRILERPVYSGKIQMGGNVGPGLQEPIIDEERWQMAQNELKRRSAGRKPIGKYLLSGLVECGLCQARMVHLEKRYLRKGKVYPYEWYYCQTKNLRKKGSVTCSIRAQRKLELETWVINQLKAISHNPTKVTNALAKTQISHKANDQLVLDLSGKIKSVTTKLDRWYAAFEDGTINSAQLKEHMDELEAEKKILLSRIEEITDIPRVDRVGMLKQSLKIISQTWDLMTLDEQQMILRNSIKKIIILPKQDPQIVWNV